MHLVIVLGLALTLATLVRARLIQVDLFLPWFIALAVLGLAATRPVFVNWLGLQLGILYPPIAVVFLVLFLVVGMLVTLTVYVSRLRARTAYIIQHLAAADLDAQERAHSCSSDASRTLPVTYA